MSKIFITFLLIIPFCFNFQGNEIKSFEYVARGRGVLKQVIIRQDSTFIRDLEKENKFLTKPETWAELKEVADKNEFKKLNLLESPTEKRFSDQALSAQLLIKTNNSEYISSEFDHGCPPKEIKKIVETLVSNFNSK